MGAKKDAPRVPGGSLTSVVGLAACAAILVGYFLPWTPHSGAVEDGLQISKEEIALEAAKHKVAGRDDRDPAQRLADGVALSGNEWAQVLDDFEDSEDLTDKQRRALTVAHVGVSLLPFAAAALAALLLLLSIPPKKAMGAGLGPIAAILAIARIRFVAGLLLILVMAMGVIVCGVSLLLWKGASSASDPTAAAGKGVQLMAVGGGAAFVSQFLGFGPGRLKALVSAILLVVGLGITYVVIGG